MDPPAAAAAAAAAARVLPGPRMQRSSVACAGVGVVARLLRAITGGCALPQEHRDRDPAAASGPYPIDLGERGVGAGTLQPVPTMVNLV